MKAMLHAIAGTLALMTVAAFLTSTLVAELLLEAADVVAVKTWIFYGVFALIPLMAATGGLGLSLANGRTDPLIDRKKTRMKRIAANGLLIMLPAAVFLSFKASAGEFDAIFYIVQILEIAGGFLQFSMLKRNFADGLTMMAKRRMGIDA